MLIVQTPLNSIAWAIGALAVGVYGYKNWRRYRQTSSYLNKYFGLFGLVLAAGLALTSYAEFFTTDVRILHRFNLASELFIYSAFVVQAQLLWFMALKNRVPSWVVLAPAALIGAAGWIANYYESTTSLSQYFVDFRYAPLAVLAQNILLGGVILPIGLVFIYQGIRELRKHRRWRALIKSLAIGLAYIGIGSSTILTNIESQGAETVESAIGNAVIFLIFLIVLLLPPLKRKKPQKTASK